MYSLDAGYGAHSSKAIMMSLPSLVCISIDFSGDMNSFEPSICERNSTPSSLIFLMPPKLKTWKPPLSVKIGLSQFINLWSPPAFWTMSSPGLKCKWYVFERMIWAPKSLSSSGVMVLTVALVPTGMKIGVSTTPCFSFIRPALALVLLSVLINSNSILSIQYKHCIAKTEESVSFFNSFCICVKYHLFWRKGAY